MALEPGSNFGAYRIIGRLGRGGMASVYKAYEPGLDRYVALKILSGDFLETPGFPERFRREARVIAKLEHPNIVPIYAFDIENGIPWMSMRLIAGGTLSALLQNGRMGGGNVVPIVRAVAGALDYAHAQGIVHRDVKPQNILLDQSGQQVYLADFGIAKMVEGSTVLTQAGMVSGTPQYMAPEQATGKLDQRTDIYALGVVTYEALTGRVPFSADTPLAVLMKHASEPIPLPSAEEVPEPMVRALLRALAKAPGDRWPSAGAFAAALAAGVSGATTGSEAPDLRSTATLAAPRHAPPDAAPTARVAGAGSALKEGPPRGWRDDPTAPSPRSFGARSASPSRHALLPWLGLLVAVLLAVAVALRLSLRPSPSLEEARSTTLTSPDARPSATADTPAPSVPTTPELALAPGPTRPRPSAIAAGSPPAHVRITTPTPLVEEETGPSAPAREATPTLPTAMLPPTVVTGPIATTPPAPTTAPPSAIVAPPVHPTSAKPSRYLFALDSPISLGDVSSGPITLRTLRLRVSGDQLVAEVSISEATGRSHDVAVRVDVLDQANWPLLTLSASKKLGGGKTDTVNAKQRASEAVLLSAAFVRVQATSNQN